MKTKRNLVQELITTPSIIELALRTKFNQDVIPTLMQIIHATPNPTVATELLLDIYEMPDIPKTGLITRQVNSKEDAYRSEVRMTSYDVWSNQVHILYMAPRVISVKLNKQRVEELLPGSPSLSEVYWATKHENPNDILFMDNCPSDIPYEWYNVVQLERIPPTEDDIYAGPDWKESLREQSEVVSLERWHEMVEKWEDLGGVPYKDAGVIPCPHLTSDETADMSEL